MDESRSIVEFTKTLATNIDRLDDYIDKFLDSYKDYAETLGDIVSPARSVWKIFLLAKRMKLKSFLKSYSRKVNEEIRFDDETVDRLQTYMTNSKNLEFIAEIIDSALNSKSTLCSAIMGFYAGEILSKTKEIEYKDILVISALKIMVDADLRNFVRLYELVNSQDMRKGYRVYDIVDKIESLGVKPFEMELTIEKLKNVQILSFDVGGAGHSGNAWGAFMFNDNTFYFYEIIRKSYVLEVRHK